VPLYPELSREQVAEVSRTVRDMMCVQPPV